VQPGRIEQARVFLVVEEGIGVPTIPQSCDNLMKFAPPFAAHRTRQCSVYQQKLIPKAVNIASRVWTWQPK
jgi:hypothetical protein